MVAPSEKKTAGISAHRMDTPVSAAHLLRPPIRPAFGLATSSAPLPLPGLEIPLYAQPVISSPAVYRLEENGRAFVLFSRDLHRSHAPLRNRGQKAIAPEHPLTRSQSQPQFGPPHFLAHPLGHIQRRTFCPEETEPEPPELPAPVGFSFHPGVEDALRRSIPPSPEPEPPSEKPPGYATATRRSSTPASKPHKQDLQLPKLLRDIGYQGAASDRHTLALINLFAQHEANSAQSYRPKGIPSRPAHLTVERRATQFGTSPHMFRPARHQTSDAPRRERKSRNRLLIEREEMAMRRKLLLRPQSLTL